LECEEGTDLGGLPVFFTGFHGKRLAERRIYAGKRTAFRILERTLSGDHVGQKSFGRDFSNLDEIVQENGSRGFKQVVPVLQVLQEASDLLESRLKVLCINDAGEVAVFLRRSGIFKRKMSEIDHWIPPLKSVDSDL
jgi:hypothetical protein